MIKKKEISRILSRIKMTQSLEEGAANADVAFETVVENKDSKIDIFNKLDALCPVKHVEYGYDNAARIAEQHVHAFLLQ